MITEEQRNNRKLGIGGSDMAIILGLSSYMTPYQLYLEKIGEAKESPETPQQYWGNKLEGVIREEFEKRNNVVVEERETIVHPFYDFLRGNVDGFIPAWNAILEVKCSSSFMANEWGDDGSDVIPMPYLVQVAHYCAVLNADCAYIAVLIGGNEYRQFKYNRDLELEMSLIESANKFWNCVITRTPPEPSDLVDLRLMFPQHQERKTAKANASINQNLSTLHSTRTQVKAFSEIEEKCKFNIMQFMEDCESLVDSNNKELATWKTNKKGTRTLLIKGN